MGRYALVPNDTLMHSGTRANHKYIRKEVDRYIYPDDVFGLEQGRRNTTPSNEYERNLQAKREDRRENRANRSDNGFVRNVIAGNPNVDVKTRKGTASRATNHNAGVSMIDNLNSRNTGFQGDKRMSSNSHAAANRRAADRQAYNERNQNAHNARIERENSEHRRREKLMKEAQTMNEYERSHRNQRLGSPLNKDRKGLNDTGISHPNKNRRKGR